MMLDNAGQEIVQKVTKQLEPDDARAVRAMKKFLQRYTLAEMIVCRECNRAGRDFEIRAIVNESKIELECPHRYLFFTGPTV